MAAVPVAHLNTWGAADIPSGKVTTNVQQAFGDTQGARGANFLDATAGFDPTTHATIVANKTNLGSILSRIILSRLLATRPTKVAVGEDKEDHLTDGLSGRCSGFRGVQAQNRAPGSTADDVHQL